ncbi:N-acetyltransferase [Halobacillus fulvus]|nr:N-acetyltransferase [Halobacillus fulvus]
MKTKELKLQAETERLIVRPLTPEDYEEWKEGFRHRLPSQSKYDGGTLDLSGWTKDMFRDVVKKYDRLAEEDEAYVLGVFRKSDQKQIGKVEISTIIRGEFQWGLLGYRIHNQFFKNGYGKEAVREGLNIAFRELGFHRIEAHINLDNLPSIRLAESVGMTYECTRKKFIYEEEEWTDNLIYYKNDE